MVFNIYNCLQSVLFLSLFFHDFKKLSKIQILNACFIYSTGHYVYVEPKQSIKSVAERAWFDSETFGSWETLCLHFDYFMGEMEPGTLRVYVINVVNDISSLVWERQGFQGGSWNHAFVALKSTDNFKVYNIDSIKFFFVSIHKHLL